jgi:tetratricopeptide (TPR) repeat protein
LPAPYPCCIIQPMFTLFDLISLVYVFRSVQLITLLARQWRGIIAEPLTAYDKHQAEQSAFFIAVPLSVFFHELAHALAVWALGGQVVGFTYRFFWGAVSHIGNYTPAERWFIALAGTLGSLLFGMAVWWLLRGNRSSALRYFGLRAFRFQIYFSLLFYPLFSAVLPIGDWRVIYDFAATPLLSGVTLAIHLGFLLFYWRFDRQGWFEAPAHETAEAQAEFERLVAETAVQPDNPNLQLQLIDILRRGGAENRALRELRGFLQRNPHSALAHLEMAALEAGKQQTISKKAATYANEALQLGLNDPHSKAAAHRMLASYQLERGDGRTAVDHYTQAIAALQQAPPSEQAHYERLLLYRERSLAYRRQKQYDLADRDLRQALELAEGMGDGGLTAVLQEDLAVLQNHTR